MSTRRKVLITGAAGGMGRACTRLLGATADLLLTDVAASALEGFAKELETEGYTVVGAHAGELPDAALLDTLVGHLREGGAFTLVHTAGLSPSQADWRRIMNVNLVATEALLQALEPHLTPGSVAVLIASTAAYSAAGLPDISALLAEPLAPGFLDKIGPTIEVIAAHAGPVGARGISYSYSKQAVIALVERRASTWGTKGARITSISPGLVLTPMGRSELENTPGAAELSAAAPASRPGTAMDVALAVQFLASDAAGFITGADLRIDGGVFAAMKQTAALGAPG